MYKKLATFFILILCAISMVGCASVEYTRVYSYDGVIIDDISITLDKTTFDTDAKAMAVLDEVKGDVQNLELAVDAWVKENFGGKYVGTDSMESYFADGYDIDIAPEVTETDTRYTFYFYIQYATLQHFIYFYGLNTDEVIETYGLYDIDDVQPFLAEDFGPFISQIIEGKYNEESLNLFITDHVWQKENAYSTFATMDRTEGQAYLDYYIDIANDTLGEDYSYDNVLDNVDVTQYYETTESRYDSNGDMGVSGQTGYYVHRWQIEDIEDSITFVRHRPNRVWWYVLAIAISLVVLAILLFIFRKKTGEWSWIIIYLTSV